MPRTTPPKDPPDAKTGLTAAPWATVPAGELITQPKSPLPELADQRQTEARYNERRELAIAEFGDGLPWSLEHYESEIRGEMRRGCESFLRAGRYLVVVRECTTHGEWQGMLDRLGLSQPQAHRMVEAARRMARLPNHSRANDLVSAAGTQSKLIELLSLPDDEFEELAMAGATGDLTIDSVAKMTRDELRAAVRDARGDIDAKDTRAANQEREIESLRKQLSKARLEANRATPDETAAKLRDKCQIAAGQCCADVLSTSEEAMSLYNRFTQLRAHAADQGNLTAHDAYLGGLIGEVMAALRSLRDELGLPIVGDHGDPTWSTGA